MVILFVALLIASLAALSLGLLGLTVIEQSTAIQQGQAIQLQQIIHSGIEAAAAAIDDPEHPDLADNPERFCCIEVFPAALNPTNGTGFFTVFSPRRDQYQVNGIRFGLINESAKLSLEAVLTWEKELTGQGSAALQKLPGMTPAIADAMLDWLDADDIARPNGGESVYYKQENKSYRPRNAVPVTLEELLLVRNINRSLLFGNDDRLMFGVNQSDLRTKPSASLGIADPYSALEPATSQSVIPQSSSSFPWVFYLTPYSAEKLVNKQGSVKIYLNESNLDFLETQLRRDLDEESVQFILSWRKAGKQIDDPVDLLDVDIETLKSPFSCSDSAQYERFLQLLDVAVTESAIVLRGRINVNLADRQVLEAVPELTPELVSVILERRKSESADRRHTVWLLAEKIVDKETMKKLSKRLTTGGDVYRLQVAAFFDNLPMFYRAEAVLDATVKPPKPVFYKDLY